jgi:hypothetical protein
MVRKYRSLARVSDLTVKTMPTMVRNTPSIPSATPDEIPLRECIGCGCYRETLKSKREAPPHYFGLPSVFRLKFCSSFVKSLRVKKL